MESRLRVMMIQAGGGSQSVNPNLTGNRPAKSRKARVKPGIFKFCSNESTVCQSKVKPGLAQRHKAARVRYMLAVKMLPRANLKLCIHYSTCPQQQFWR